MIQVIDNAIPQYLQDFYELLILGKSGNQRVKPVIDLHCKYEKTAIDEKGNMPVSFVHLLKTQFETSKHLPNFYQIIDIYCKNSGDILHDVIAGRIYLTTPQNTSKSHYDPHIDMQKWHKVLLYYVNDADGDTVFFDKKGNVTESVSPKKGRLVVFNGDIYHAAGIPKNNHRCVVNFDINVEETSIWK
jgi:hypothetical protein